MTEPVAARPKVFISYSHKDEGWKDKIVDHLSIVAREEDFDVWQDRKIDPGSEWHETIVRQIEEAGVAILLVSVDFLKSDFIRNEEVKRFLDRREKAGPRIYPVIVHECPWKRVPWLSRLQVRPVDGEALSQWEGHRLNQELTKITDEIARILETVPPPIRLSRKDQFLAAFRRRLEPEYSRWDLGTVGVTQPGGASRPIETDLDVMYLPLRLAEGFDLSETGRGAELSPDELLGRKAPLVIRGSAGSGKTTWMRWTFRKLLRMEGSALPLMLVLRDLATRWQDHACKGAARSLDTFLESWIAEHIGPGWEGLLPELLAAETGTRPVLLVDGWDELGPLGEELRSKLLGFLGQFPRVLAVVTSRPYGEGRPSGSDRFEVLDIQPLSDAEISDFSSRFFTHCHGGEEAAVRRDAEHFARALKLAPEAQALARTALLLTMMLLISRSRPLPDKRHLLYEACIENLLTALQKRKEQEGALLGREQWRPPDSEERMRIVAALAAGLQEKTHSSRWARSSIVFSWDDMASLLPGDWSEKQKLGFLSWLAGPAGLLTDRADGTLSFAHLSFQEYLTAWRFNAEVEGAEERAKTFERLAKNETWWETLRLWAALVEKQSRLKLGAALTSLIGSGESGLMLAGAIFADGLGTEESFAQWAEKLSQPLGSAWLASCDLCAQAWASSRQDERKAVITRRLSEAAPTQTWLGWLRFEEFARVASLTWKGSPSLNPVDRILLNQLAGAPAASAADVAVGRLLAGASPVWPVDPLPIGLFQIWPGERRLAGLRLQLAAVSGCARGELTRLAAVLLSTQKTDETEARSLASGLARDWARDWARNWPGNLTGDWVGDLSRDLARYLARDWARGWARYWARYWARNSTPVSARTRTWARDSARDSARSFALYWTRDWAPDWAPDWARDWARNSARDWARNWARDLVEDLAHDLANGLGVNPNEPWFRNFYPVDFFSFGHAGVRVSLASSRTIEERAETSLLSQACQLSLHPDRDSNELDQLLVQLTPALDPLWPALARHLARRSTPEDRALLTNLVQHPEMREPPLSWGLQFIVRGDVMLADCETVVTLDQLADEAGVPHLPYLEDMPDELEVDWEKE